MANVEITDGTTDVVLTNDNPDVSYASDQLTEDFQLVGTNTGEVVDLQSFSDMITISCFITDLDKFNGIQTLRRSTSTITFKWNDADAKKPNIDHANADGTVVVVIAGVSLHQKPGTPSTQYDMTVKLKPNITA